ncbi:dTMP kinase [Acetohalobium arabaticum]|uniref:Thymidylate kinase n=1 Tax=Acetohalobium arabaticum (strain ATCC 49924 / DSM 5501 / Z-7288) TaxID=574087 RepID=D9QSQ6_ACEAZ|nr:dTMP kinase [Acetohalobium arabaticum]ADL11594.1 thymidylate kinase [Acetohalobium arabaticum DSM 5501]
MKGLFITLEGPEGAGKSTQIELLNKYFSEQGYEVVQTREPGGTEIGSRIRNILLDSNLDNLEPKTELLLYAASRAQHVNEVIKPALKEGKVIICDRFSDATLAYQGYGRRLDKDLILKLNQMATGGLEPDLTFLLDIEPEEGLLRTKNEVRDRIEREDLSFHQQVRDGYLKLAEKKSRFEVIDGSQSIENIFDNLIETLEERLELNEDSE